MHYEPIEYFKRKGKSKIRPIRDTINFIQLIIRTVAYFNPLKVFVPVSIFLFFVSILLFIIGRMGILFAESLGGRVRPGAAEVVVVETHPFHGC